MLRGDPYDANDPTLLAERSACRTLCERYNALAFADEHARQAALSVLVGSLGEAAVVMSPFECDYGTTIEIGPRTFINYGAILLDGAPVVIGADVQIGPRVQLITSLHPLDPVQRARGTETAEPVTVHDGAWLAAGVIVCPGVTVGAGCVVGAGSVVTRSLPAGYLCLGTPCRPVRELPAG
jgi:maltose O-acetyltransferase